MPKVVATRSELDLNDSERRLLNSWIRAGTTPQRVVRRARIVLKAAEGVTNRGIARELKVSSRTVMLWRSRFEQYGPEGLLRDAPGRGRKPSIGADDTLRVRALMQTAPPRGERWTVRLLAQATGLSRASTHRLMRAFQS